MEDWLTNLQINRIDKLKSFGSFENFRWLSLPEFKQHNFIYGKNGSGKTTLSRFLQSFEENGFPDDYVPSPSMEITVNQDKHSDFDVLRGRIKVFNIYYIANNLFWDDVRANNLLWLG